MKKLWGHPDRITEEPIEDVDTQTYEKFIQASQDTVNQSENIPIDPFLLSSSGQDNSIFLGINPDDLDESQASLAKHQGGKMILPNDGNTTEEDDADMDLNISGDDFDLEFPSGQKILSIQFPRSNIPAQMDISTPSPTQQKPLAPCSSNKVPPSTQTTPLPSWLLKSTGLRLFLILTQNVNEDWEKRGDLHLS